MLMNAAQLKSILEKEQSARAFSAFELFQAAASIDRASLLGEAEQRDDVLKKAYELLKVADGIIRSDGKTISDQRKEEKEEKRDYEDLMQKAKFADDYPDLKDLAAREPDKVVQWDSDCVLHALDSENKDTDIEGKSLRSARARRVYYRFRSRMQADKRDNDLKPQSAGVQAKLLWQILGEERKRGPRKEGEEAEQGQTTAAEQQETKSLEQETPDLSDSESNK